MYKLIQWTAAPGTRSLLTLRSVRRTYTRCLRWAESISHRFVACFLCCLEFGSSHLAVDQVSIVFERHAMIDIDTPEGKLTRPSYTDPTQYLQLIFSDEFNVDGRTFYPGASCLTMLNNGR
jgi:hypothetical protein